LEGERKDERIGQVVDGLEHGDVLHEGAVPYDTEKECADENGQHEHQKFHECFGASFGLGYFLNHLLQVEIFFCINYK